MTRSRAFLALVCFIALGVSGLAAPARADIPPPDYDFMWANITDLNNAAYAGGPPYNGNAGRGSVSYAYRVSKLEITTQQWADFLSMVLRQGVNPDQYSLRPVFWGATKSGGQYFANEPMRPVIGLNWRAGAYYCNWLNNGKLESWNSCKSGAYDTATFGGNPGSPYTDQLYHSPGAKFWIPTLDEYLKASHYDPDKNGSGQGGWWAYPYQSDLAPIPGAPGVGETSGGWDPGDFSELGVDLGAYTSFTSAYGLWDLSGGSREWVEEPRGDPPIFARRGQFGSYAGDRAYRDADHVQSSNSDYPGIIGGFSGFRIAGQIPSPSTVALTFVGVSGFLFRRRR